MNYKICPKCNGKIAHTLIKCIHCDYIYDGFKACPSCGISVSNDESICNVCGYSFVKIQSLDNNIEEELRLPIKETDTKEKNINSKIGKIFEFGKYKGEVICWKVLDIVEKKYLL